MGVYLLGVVIASLILAMALISQRRLELIRMSKQLGELVEAKTTGSHTARLQYPHIDLTRCIGCDACVKACPEDGVLGMIHGQAAVIYGARCVGHGRCATACPVGAIGLTLANVEARRDLPALNEHFEAIGSPGLYLAGEVTGYALIRTAISHGTAVIDRIADQLASSPAKRSKTTDEVYDVVIIGAGPAGVAASLQAKKRQLKYLTLEQEQLGGTVSKYPRRKLVMTQPVSLPLYGTLKRSTYTKEALMELWESIADSYQLAIKVGVQFKGLAAVPQGYRVETDGSSYLARTVCVAIGRRGTPVKLGVPGESLPKVAYGLTDAQSFQNRKILVVGGGDSAVEAALGLSTQPGNEVTLSYRKGAFSRIKSRNQAALQQALQNRQLDCVLNSEVIAISERAAMLSIGGSDRCTTHELENDDVFILAGGVPPFQLLESCGVSFDPQDRQPPPPVVDQGAGLFSALVVTLVLAIALFAWTWWFREYYRLPPSARVFSAWHGLLRPSGWLGLGCGALAVLFVIANLSYLLRRRILRDWIPGKLTHWLTVHVTTGISALLLVLIHSAFAPGDTIGGHAMACMAVLVATGAIGRYFYSFLPRAANGKELELGEIESIIAADLSKWDTVGREYYERVQSEIQLTVAQRLTQRGLLQRLAAIIRSPRIIREKIRKQRRDGLASGLSSSQVDQIAGLTGRAYRSALSSAYFEDLRALLNSWRYLHRWVALLLVGLTIAHIVLAIRYLSPR